MRGLNLVAPGFLAKQIVDRWGTPPPTPHAGPAALPHRFYVDTPTHRLAAWDEGTGPTVLLAHGWGGNASHFDPLIPRLLSAGYHVVAFDMPAHGQSSGTRTNVVQFAEAVSAVAARLRPVHAVIGHSLGGAGTSIAAADGLEVNRVALLAAPSEVVTFLRRFLQFTEVPESALPHVADEVRRVAGRAIGEIDLTTRRPFSQPALLIHDTGDRDVPVDQSRRLAAHWTKARLVETHGLGHRKVLKDAAVADQLLAFLAEV